MFSLNTLILLAVVPAPSSRQGTFPLENDWLTKGTHHMKKTFVQVKEFSFFFRHRFRQV
jgi:hypothetical protein